MKPAAHLNNLSFDQRDSDLGEDILDHVTKWNKCHKCPLAGNAEHHVFFRGSIPCDILFIGEAPGTSEDSLGTPFIGRSGKLLDQILAEVKVHDPFSYLISNTVACIPLNESGEIRPPTKEETAVCLERVVDLCELALPKGIVLIGKVAQKIEKRLLTQLQKTFNWFDDTDEEPFPTHLMLHPEHLLKKGGSAQTNTDYRRTVLELRKFIQKVKTT